MLRPSELPLLEDQADLFDDLPDLLASGLLPKRSDADDEGIGLRSLLDQPDALSHAWRATTQKQKARRGSPKGGRHAVSA